MSISKDKYKWRREVVFIFLAGIFLGSLTMLNILGLSRLINLSFTIFGLHIPFIFFVGVLPYPITFLCTDFISELYGKKRANLVVWVGLFLNLWVLFILWIGGILPEDPNINSEAFFKIRAMTFGAVLSSMIAYLSAQFIDVQLFHFLKKKTKGKHLWLRNNGSTLISQLVDSIIVTMVTFFIVGFNFENDVNVTRQIIIIILSGYVFKLVAALLDTIPFYIGVKYLSKFLDIDTTPEND
ncbi:MAG: transporter [Marinilabiliales bacterium]|nr:MAG: transporter [Marinilabiliales bacterium]